MFVRSLVVVAYVARASAHMPGEYHPPGSEGQLERFLDWLWEQSSFRMPNGDGAKWYADPQLVSNILLGVIAVLMLTQYVDFFLHLRSRGTFDRGGYESPLRLRQRSTALVRVLRHKMPRRPRQQVDFARARATLEAKLSTMVGLEEVKAHLSALLDTLEMDARRCAHTPGFVTQRGCMHMVFLGNPGTGKTAVANLVAVLLKEMGLLRRGHLVVAKKSDLLGRYSNHVARNTRAVIRSAIGGVLLIDEAYALLQGEVDLGRECLNVLVDMCCDAAPEAPTFPDPAASPPPPLYGRTSTLTARLCAAARARGVDAHRDDLVVVLAGYSESMAACGKRARLPYLRTAPHWCLLGLRPLLRAPEPRLSSSDACRGLRSSPRAAAPKVKILPVAQAGMADLFAANAGLSSRRKSGLCLGHPTATPPARAAPRRALRTRLSPASRVPSGEARVAGNPLRRHRSTRQHHCRVLPTQASRRASRTSLPSPTTRPRSSRRSRG